MIEIKDFTQISSVSQARFSPDGRSLAFVLQKPDLEKNNYSTSLWLWEKDTGKCRELTRENKDPKYLWLDSENLLYPGYPSRYYEKKIQEGEPWTIIYRINLKTGRRQEYCKIPLNVRTLERAGKDLFFLTAQYNGQLPDLHALKDKPDLREKAVEEIRESRNYEEIDEIPIWGDGAGFISRQRTRLYLYSRKQGKLTPLTDEYTNVDLVRIKENRILIVSKRYEGVLTHPGIHVYDIKTGKMENLLPEDRYVIFHADFLGDQIVFIGTEKKTGLLTDNPKFYRIEKGEVKLWADPDISVRDTVGYDCKYGEGIAFKVFEEKLYFVSTGERSSFLKCLDARGNLSSLTGDNGAVHDFDLCPEGIAFCGLRGMGLQELYLLKGGEEKQLTFFNKDYLSKKNIVPAETMVFKNNGYNVHYVVLKPGDYNPSKKYPALLYIHGGAKVLYGPVFFHEMQVLANRGFFVIYGNPRGSDGQGSLFARLQGHYGEPDYQDMMKAMDTALERYPQIDKDRLGVAGGSYGGIMTNWIIGHTNRFKCAVSQRSICNMISTIGTADNGYNFVREQMDSDPWNNLEKLWEQSPLKYAPNIKTPLLLIHSEQDYRCHYTESIQLFTALKYFGVETKVFFIRGENHGLSRTGRPKQRIRRLTEIVGWLEKHLK